MTLPVMMGPVCFGSVAFFDPAQPTCAACVRSRSCLEAALQRVKLLPDTLMTRSARVRLETVGRAVNGAHAVVALSRRGIARRDLTQQELEGIDRLPMRARSTALKLARRGWFDHARSLIADGREPSGIEGSRLLVAIKRLLAGACTRQCLVQAYVDAGLQPSSAQVETSTALSVLQYGRLARSEAGFIVLESNSQH